MIVDSITLRVKNIIFFKVVSLSILITGICYAISAFKAEYASVKYKLIKTQNLIEEAEDRLKALNINDKNLTIAIEEYQKLKANENISIEECFDKDEYTKKISGIEQNFAIRGKTSIFASSNSILKKDQPKKSVVMKTTTINLDYIIQDMEQAVKFAKNAYELLPPYNLVRSIEIIKQTTITPATVSLFEDSIKADLYSVKLNLEVKELNLND